MTSNKEKQEGKGKVQSVVAYMGSKRNHLDFIERNLPPKWEREKHRYLEPFLGSGIVFHHINPQQAVIADASPYLVSLFNCLQQDVQRFITSLRELYDRNSLAQYNQSKKDIMKDKDPFRVAAGFVYVHRTSLYSFACPRMDLSEFRGTYKNNRGKPRPIQVESEKWTALGQALSKPGVSLIESDFEPIIDQARKGDFLFLDPPYIGTGTRVYLKFTKEDHLRLMAKIREASQRGVFIMMFNHSGLDLSANPELSETPVPIKKRTLGDYIETMYTNYVVVHELQERPDPTR